MKTNTLFKLFTLLVIPVLFYFVFQGFTGTTETNGEKVTTAPAPNNGKNFQNIIFNNPGTNPDDDSWVLHQIGNYKGVLNFTGIHIYDLINGSDNGTVAYGRFNDNLSGTQLTNISTLNSAVTGAGLDFYYERCKISKLCYAQRLIYEVANGNNHTDVNDGFCYRTCGGNYTTDQGRTVLHTGPPTQDYPNGYWLAKDIYENMQHGDMIDFNPQYADMGIWHVKPMMKIPQNVPGETPVVRIDIYNYNNNNNTGTPIRSVTIKARNFDTYGSYTDQYTFLQGEPDLNVTGGDGKIHNPALLNDGMMVDSWIDWPNRCHVDFKVYWLGQVECWFDKMTVDDEYAGRLFSGNYDALITDQTSPEFFLATALMWRHNKFLKTSYGSVNYVMNVMYNKLQNKAQQITLK